MVPVVAQNILYIQSGQHRRDALGCYGDRLVQTPRRDTLAANGIRFDNAFTCTGVCTPSRGAVLSGRYRRYLDKWMAEHKDPLLKMCARTKRGRQPAV